MVEWIEIGPCKLACGDCREAMATLPDNSVHCCVTSPPYWGLRDYGVDGQLGLEQTPEEYVANMVQVFREVRRVLRDDGTLWLNLGDSYARQGGATDNKNRSRELAHMAETQKRAMNKVADGYKPKDLVGIPWRVAFALQADGWYLRQDIIWHKPNPMPESVTDRCTKSHEYIFLLSKSARYYYDQKAIAEPLADSSVARLSQVNLANQNGSDRIPGKTNGAMKAVGPRFGGSKYGDDESELMRTKSGNEWTGGDGLRNRRSVWTVTTQPFKEAHFATFPPKLIEPCILAGCPEGGTVLDPFNGAGTTAIVCIQNGRQYVGAELNPEYMGISERRIREELDKTALLDMACKPTKQWAGMVGT